MIPSIGLGVFGGVGLLLLAVIDGLFTQNAGPAIVRSVSIGWPFAAVCGALLFVTVSASVKRMNERFDLSFKDTGKNDYFYEADLNETLLSVGSFVVVLSAGTACMFAVVTFVSWWWLVTIIALGGLCGVFHGWFLYFRRVQIRIKTEVKRKFEDPESMKVYVTSLELEHGFFQTYFQQFAYGAIIFFTAGVVGYYLNYGQTTGVNDQSIVNASIMIAWFIAGLFYGIFIPIQKHMEFVRGTIGKLVFVRVWVFGYGSLIWDTTGMTCLERREGELRGWHRDWTHLSHHRFGAPTCNLEAGGKVKGVFLKLDPRTWRQDLERLREREGTKTEKVEMNLEGFPGETHFWTMGRNSEKFLETKGLEGTDLYKALAWRARRISKKGPDGKTAEEYAYAVHEFDPQDKVTRIYVDELKKLSTDSKQ